MCGKYIPWGCRKYAPEPHSLKPFWVILGEMKSIPAPSISGSCSGTPEHSSSGYGSLRFTRARTRLRNTTDGTHYCLQDLLGCGHAGVDKLVLAPDPDPGSLLETRHSFFSGVSWFARGGGLGLLGSLCMCFSSLTASNSSWLAVKSKLSDSLVLSQTRVSDPKQNTRAPSAGTLSLVLSPPWTCQKSLTPLFQRISSFHRLQACCYQTRHR